MKYNFHFQFKHSLNVMVQKIYCNIMYEIHKQLKTPVVVYELSFLSKHFCMFVIIMRCKAACVVKSGSNRGVKYTDPHILGQPQE